MMSFGVVTSYSGKEMGTHQKPQKKFAKQGKKISTSAVSNNQVTKAGNLADTEFFSKKNLKTGVILV